MNLRVLRRHAVGPAAVVLTALLALAGGCQPQQEVVYNVDPMMALAAWRAKKDVFMRSSPESPFQGTPKVPFTPLKYYLPDASWIYHSRLEVFPTPQPVDILDTEGKKRPGVAFGRLSFTREGRDFSLTVYRLAGDTPGTFEYSVWFTDRTTGDTTYEVGRYLEFNYVKDPDHEYTIDFNYAYNPYCAYSSSFACPIPRKEDYLDLAVTAGEKKWHD